jgi:hypothetical protein
MLGQPVFRKPVEHPMSSLVPMPAYQKPGHRDALKAVLVAIFQRVALPFVERAALPPARPGGEVVAVLRPIAVPAWATKEHAHLETMKDRNLAEQTGRTLGAVRDRRYVLGVPRVR